jgi:hypothetical protein
LPGQSANQATLLNGITVESEGANEQSNRVTKKQLQLKPQLKPQPVYYVL